MSRYTDLKPPTSYIRFYSEAYIRYYYRDARSNYLTLALIYGENYFGP